MGESNAVKNLNGVLIHPVTSVRVEALPQDIPHRIDVDLSKLETMEDAITIKDIPVDRTRIRLLDDPDELVAKVVQQRAEEVVAPPPTEAAVPVEGAPVEGEAPAPAAGAAAPAECFEADSHCSIAPVCRLRGALKEAVDAFYGVLDRYTLEDLVKRTVVGHPRRGG